MKLLVKSVTHDGSQNRVSDTISHVTLNTINDVVEMHQSMAITDPIAVSPFNTKCNLLYNVGTIQRAKHDNYKMLYILKL